MSSLWKHGNKVNVDYKARLEHKLYLARENPEPVFDVSECALKNVPSGIYSLCKVFRKRILLMHNNKLSSFSGGGALSDLSLLTVLDIHSNEFTSLPTEIKCLVSLKELYLQNNNIRKLPNEIVHLSNLNILDVSDNNLKQLPEAIGELRRLTTLDISANRTLEKLPKSLGYLQLLQTLNIEGLNLNYPPSDIIDGGTIVIVAYCARECGIEYDPERFAIKNDASIENDSSDIQAKYYNANNELQASIKKLEKLKECRQNALLEVEKNIQEQQRYEFQARQTLETHRQNLLKNLATQQTQLEHELEKMQQEKDINRARLLSHICNAEIEADNVIQEFLKHSEESKQSQAKLVEQEKEEELRFLSACHLEQSTLRTKDTLIAMEKLIEEEFTKAQKFAEYTRFRDNTVQSLLSLEVENNFYLTELVHSKERNRQNVVETLRQNEALQKAAVAALLERSDARFWSIIQQVKLVQTQLAMLTNIELERKKLQVNQQLNEISEKRVALSAILMDLLEQETQRRNQLLETIKHIEEKRDLADLSRRGSQFWLMQYQSLMEARPQGLLEMLEPTLVRHVAISGALHCLPFLSTLPSMLPNFSEDQLKQIGIHNENDRRAIALAVENYLEEMKLNEMRLPTVPSAPIEYESSDNEHRNIPNTPSAPLEEELIPDDIFTANNTQCIPISECVVCLDLQSEIIFLPCGHLCCCMNCANMVTSNCPLCRSDINFKIPVVSY